MKCMWKRGCLASQSVIALVLCVARLSQIRCTSSSSGTALSMAVRNFLNSTARCWRCSSVITVPVGDVKRREQVDDTVARVIVGAPLGHARHHR